MNINTSAVSTNVDLPVTEQVRSHGDFDFQQRISFTFDLMVSFSCLTVDLEQKHITV